MILKDRLPYLDRLTLGPGNHPPPSNGMTAACVMEAVSYIAGEAWSNAPACASPVIARFLVSWNDALPDDDRQMLKPYVPRLVGTRTTSEDEQTRAWMLADWLARECTPAWMRLAGLTAQAEALARLAPLVSPAAACAAQPILAVAEKDSAAASAAAWAAAWAAASTAASTAARDAASAAASTAARDAASAAASTAARDAASDAAWAAAWAAARAAARDAASTAAWAAASTAAWAAASTAARDAASTALRPTVTDLQASALLLLDRLIAVGRAA